MRWIGLIGIGLALLNSPSSQTSVATLSGNCIESITYGHESLIVIPIGEDGKWKKDEVKIEGRGVIKLKNQAGCRVGDWQIEVRREEK